jgi:hypothetical protein
MTHSDPVLLPAHFRLTEIIGWNDLLHVDVRLSNARTYNDALEIAERLEHLAGRLRQTVETWRPKEEPCETTSPP